MPKDFGDILDRWERSKFGGDPGVEKSGNVMETWLNNNKVYDKDAEEGEESVQGQQHRRNKLRNSKPDAILDIHGFTGEKAWLALDSFFAKAKENSFQKIRVIHGKGNHSQGEAVLRDTVREFIEKCPFAGESGYEKAPNGGSGATWVLLKH
jgi:DNA-nicking Smr family endonuclease